jgi:hypothetical protein
MKFERLMEKKREREKDYGRETYRVREGEVTVGERECRGGRERVSM